MKYNINILVIFAAILLIFSQSCKKEEVLLIDNQEFRTYLSTEFNMENHIKLFIDKLEIVRENQEYNSIPEWNYSKDSCLWFIEAALNYKYAYPDEQRDKMFSYAGTKNILLNSNQEINILDIQNTYDSIFSEIENDFINISAEHKFFIGIDIEFDLEDCTESNLKLRYKYFIGKFAVNLPDGDWMISGGQTGNGGLYGGDGTFAYYDGTDKLEQEIFRINKLHEVDGKFYVDQTFIGAGNNIPFNPTFNFAPFNAWFTYSQSFANWLPQYQNSPQVYIPEFIMDEYVSYLPNVLSYSDAQDPSKRIYIEDFFFSFNLIVIGGPIPHHHYYDTWFYEATSHPRIFPPSTNLFQ